MLGYNIFNFEDVEIIDIENNKVKMKSGEWLVGNEIPYLINNTDLFLGTYYEVNDTSHLFEVFKESFKYLEVTQNEVSVQVIYFVWNYKVYKQYRFIVQGKVINIPMLNKSLELLQNKEINKIKFLEEVQNIFKNPILNLYQLNMYQDEIHEGNLDKEIISRTKDLIYSLKFKQYDDSERLLYIEDVTGIKLADDYIYKDKELNQVISLENVPHKENYNVFNEYPTASKVRTFVEDGEIKIDLLDDELNVLYVFNDTYNSLIYKVFKKFGE